MNISVTAKLHERRSVISIVGTSRSGKTALVDILQRSDEVFCFRELHFFNSSAYDKGGELLTKDEAADLYARLLDTQENGILGRGDHRVFLQPARHQVAARELAGKTAYEVYESFLVDYAERAKPGSRPCDQTGGYVYFLRELLDHLPEVRIICMVRDPRFVVASKKEKWSWKQVRKYKYPVREWVRQKLQYHPWIVTRLWVTTAREVIHFKAWPQIRIQKFELLRKDTERQVREICEFLDIKYDDDMCSGFNVQSGGIDDVSSRAPATPRDLKLLCSSLGLSRTELYIIQLFSGPEMKLLGYEPWDVKPNPIMLLWSFALLPVTFLFAALVNIRRTGNMLDAIRRRFLRHSEMGSRSR